VTVVFKILTYLQITEEKKLIVSAFGIDVAKYDTDHWKPILLDVSEDLQISGIVTYFAFTAIIYSACRNERLGIPTGIAKHEVLKA
jgi:hypothetical protein